jgi:dihydrofolate reductase
MKAIVAVDLNWGIGLEGNLLEKIPEDMKFFREKTINKIVVMGRETLESFPNKNPLKDRINIVLTRKEKYNSELITCSSLEDALAELKKYNDDDIFIIGGESIYKQFLPYCDKVYVTKINNKYKADKYFVNLDTLDNWNVSDISEVKKYKGVEFNFLTYINNDVKEF